jgi:C-terminal processing protease CtpA/Prc
LFNGKRLFRKKIKIRKTCYEHRYFIGVCTLCNNKFLKQMTIKTCYRVEKIAPNSPAGNAGLKNMDYLVKVNGQEVFDMNHNDLVKLIRDCKADTLELEIERLELLL